jgi:hypothetical protein
VNLGQLADGSVVLFDASALSGPPAFDAARWAARLAPWSFEPLDLFARWLRIEHLEHDHKAEQLLAVECLMEAGARAANQQGGSTAGMPSDRDDSIERLMTIARTILQYD